MKTFDDLTWENRGNEYRKEIMAKMTFHNGYEITIYRDHKNEIIDIKRPYNIYTKNYGDSLSDHDFFRCNIEEVNKIMKKIQGYP